MHSPFQHTSLPQTTTKWAAVTSDKCLVLSVGTWTTDLDPIHPRSIATKDQQSYFSHNFALECDSGSATPSSLSFSDWWNQFSPRARKYHITSKDAPVRFCLWSWRKETIVTKQI